MTFFEAYGTGMPKIMKAHVGIGHIVRSDVDKLLDVSQATSNRILKRMVSDGLIYQNGSGRQTKYVRK